MKGVIFINYKKIFSSIILISLIFITSLFTSCGKSDDISYDDALKNLKMGTYEYKNYELIISDYSAFAFLKDGNSISTGLITEMHSDYTQSDFIVIPKFYLKDTSEKFGFELAYDDTSLILYYSTSRSNAINGAYDPTNHNISFTFKLVE